MLHQDRCQHDDNNELHEVMTHFVSLCTTNSNLSSDSAGLDVHIWTRTSCFGWLGVRLSCAVRASGLGGSSRLGSRLRVWVQRLKLLGIRAMIRAWSLFLFFEGWVREGGGLCMLCSVRFSLIPECTQQSLEVQSASGCRVQYQDLYESTDCMGVSDNRGP